MTVDGETLSGAAFAREGVTYAPLVPLLDALGGWETTWDPSSRTASAETALFDLDVPVGRSHVLADGFPFSLSAGTLVWGGRTYVPLRSVANLLGAQVDFAGWDSPVEVRTASDIFPDTIKEVIFDRKDAVQFEPVSNGTIYDEPTAQSVLAAQLVLGGTSVAGDCLYFFNPEFSRGTWIRENRTWFSQIGCHLFYL